MASDVRDAMLAAALATAKRGWPVFPTLRGRKQPALHGRKDCPGTGACAEQHQGWEQRATTDPERVRWYWTSRRYAGCNIGLATGPAGLVVVDLDVPKPDKPVPDHLAAQGIENGMDVFLTVCAEAGEVPPLDTLTVTTPSGGTHLYFAAPAGVELRITEGDKGRGLGWAIDTRAHGGYVLAPRSIVDGGIYTVAYAAPVAELPRWLVDRLAPEPVPQVPVRPLRVASTDRKSKYLQAAVEAEVARVTGAPRGQRNSCLFVAALALGQLVAGGELAEADARAALMLAAAKHIGVGRMTERRAEATIRDGLAKGANRPRRVVA